MENGWIKIHRKFLEWEWFDIPEMVKLFMFLLLSANYEDKYWRGIIISRGQFVTSLQSLSEKTKLSVRTIRTCLERLKSTGELTSETTNRYTVITICKYDDYQQAEKQNDKQNDTPTDKQTTNKRQTNDKQTTTTKEYKEIEERKEDEEGEQNSTSPPPEFSENIKFNAPRELPEIFKEMDKNKLWKEQMCMKHAIPGSTAEIKLLNFDKYLSDFYKFLTIDKQVKHKSLSDTYSHFSNWLPKQIVRND